jgi:hypothetical protein
MPNAENRPFSASFLLHSSSRCVCQRPASPQRRGDRESSPSRSVVEYAASSAVAVDESGAGSGDRLRLAVGGQ